MQMINLFLITIGLLCTSCNSQQELDFLQTSARNRKIDTQNFTKVKRLPLYNAKYIAKAKRNIFIQEYGYDAYDDQKELIEMKEGQNLREQNKNAYKSMIENDIHKKHIQLKKAYPNDNLATNHKEEMIYNTDQTESLKKHDKPAIKKQKKIAKKRLTRSSSRQKIQKTLLSRTKTTTQRQTTQNRKSKILLDDLYHNSKTQIKNYDVIKPISYLKNDEIK